MSFQSLGRIGLIVYCDEYEHSLEFWKSYTSAFWFSHLLDGESLLITENQFEPNRFSVKINSKTFALT